jgi:hypothetical protein
VPDPEVPNPDETPTEATPVEPPTEASAPSQPSEPVPVTEAMPVDTASAEGAESSVPSGPSEPKRPFWDTGRVIAAGILVLLLGGGAGFLIGHETADSGPTSLADAVHETAKGDLPAGDLSLDDLLGAARDRLGKDGGLGGLLGGSGTSGASGEGGVLGQILEQLGKLGDNGTTTSPATPATGQAFLGVALEAAPTGQTGGKVAQLAAGSPAADAGLRVGDVVTAVDGTAVADPGAAAAAIRAHAPGDQITLTITRDGASSDVKARLGNAESSTTTPATPPTTRTT